MTKTLNALADNLRYLLERHGLNPNSLATLVKNQPPQPTIQRIRNGDVQTPRDATIKPIADYFGVSVHALRYEDLSQQADAPLHETGARASRLRTLKVPVINIEDIRHRDPLWDDEGTPRFTPDNFANLATTDPHAFLVLVDEDDLSPRFKPGEYARIEPSREIEIEDEVLVRTTAGDVYLARLLTRRGGRLRLGYYSQREPESIPTDHVSWCYSACHPVPTDDVGNF